MSSLPPALFFLVAAFLSVLFNGSLRRLILIAAPVAALFAVHFLPEGVNITLPFLDQELVLCQTDRLNRVFGYIFCIISILAVLFAFQNEDRGESSSALIYAGGALGVTFAGDFLTLYVFWELMAVASTFVILAARTRESRQAAFRYVLVHLAGGLLLLAGILLRYEATGSLEVGFVGLEGLAGYLIFAGIAVNAAIPPVHSWLKDAYPAASWSGAVFLSAFTTKSAVYLMARTFPGTELLIWLGVIMALVPLIYAVLENDIRRVLSYCLINQVGFMLVGIGIGSVLAINGAVSHAFVHILYKALLFMGAGAVLYRTGKIRCTDLGGLYSAMPLTCLFTLIGALSISGFVSKSMIVSAAGYEQLLWVWLVLQFASVGVFFQAGIKVSYFMFFGRDSGLRPKEAPWNMTLAMGAASVLSIGIVAFPQMLYGILPYPVEYAPHTASHVVAQLQTFLFSGLAFGLMLASGIYPAEIRSITLDTDWFYRKGASLFYAGCDRILNPINKLVQRLFGDGLPKLAHRFFSEPGANLEKLLILRYLKAKGSSGEAVEQRRERISRRYRYIVHPLGGGVLLSVMFLALMSYLYIIR